MDLSTGGAFFNMRKRMVLNATHPGAIRISGKELLEELN